MIQRKITFPHTCSDANYGKICLDAEESGYFVKCGSVADKRLWLQFESEEKEREWMRKIGMA